jgi:hypothetical protein
MCAMRVFNVGDVLAAADVNEQLVNTRFAVKPSDTSRTSNPNLSNDPDLQVVADANKMYDLYLNLSYISPTAAGFQIALTVPSGTTLTGAVWVVNNSTGGVGQGTAYAAGAPATPLHFTSTTSIIYNIVMRGTLNTAGTGGNVTLQWCQDASNASATLAKAGSSLLLRRVS